MINVRNQRMTKQNKLTRFVDKYYYQQKKPKLNCRFYKYNCMYSNKTLAFFTKQRMPHSVTHSVTHLQFNTILCGIQILISIKTTHTNTS